MGQSRLDKDFALDRSSRITDVWVNRLLTILETRIGGIEGKAADFDEAAASLVSLGLNRINEALIPALDRLSELVDLGFLLASSSSEITLELGAPTVWVIPPGPQRDFFTPSAFVIVMREGTVDDYAVVQTIGYDKEYGEYTGTPISITGAPGPHSDWQIGALAGSTLAQIELVGDAEDARDDAALSAADALEAAIDVAEAREEVEDNREIVQTLSATYSIMWWGQRVTAPPLVGIGAAIVGSQYLDMTSSPPVVRVWNGSSWAPTVTIALGGIRRQDWTAVAGGTLNGPYAVGGGFSAGDVYRNGVLVDDAKVTFTTGEAGSFSFTGLSLEPGDEIAFRGYMANDTVDSYTKAEADARYLRLSNTGVAGRSIAAAATTGDAQTAIGMSTYGKSLIALASAAALLTSLGVNAYVSGNIFNKGDAAAIRAELSVQPTNSPAFTGAPTVPTAAPGTNNTQAASTAFVSAALNALVAAAPGTLDTLNELAAALGNDPNFATSIVTTLNSGAQIAAAAADSALDDADQMGFRRAADGVFARQTWAEHKTQLATVFASLSGATMTGDLTIAKAAAPALILNKTTATVQNTVSGRSAGLERWRLVMGDETAEGGANAGSDFRLERYADAGTLLGAVLSISRSAATVAGEAIATAANYRANLAGKLLTTDGVWAAAVPVSLGTAISGNISINPSQWLHWYGSASGNFVFSGLLGTLKNQSGTIRITAVGGNRTVGFNTAVFATPNNAPLPTIASGTTRLYSYLYDSVLGKMILIDLGTIS